MVCQSPWSFIQFDCCRVEFLDIVFISLNTLLIKNGPIVKMIRVNVVNEPIVPISKL